MVGGVNPRKAGQQVDFDGTELPVFDSVGEAMAETGADATVIFVPPAFTKGAVLEAIDAEIPLAVVITEGMPVHDTAPSGRTTSPRQQDPHRRAELPRHRQPGQVQRRHHPGRHRRRRPDRPGQQVRHADLPDDVRAARHRLLHRVGIGGDPIIGTTHIDALAAFQADPDTDAIVMIGEIGGDAEERAADFIKANVTKPVVGYIAGFTAPPGKTMGHAGAIISGSAGTADAKKVALEAAGVKVGKTPSETAKLMRELMSAPERRLSRRGRPGRPVSRF